LLGQYKFNYRVAVKISFKDETEIPFFTRYATVSLTPLSQTVCCGIAIMQLCGLMRYRLKLLNIMLSEKSCLQNSLTMSNIQLANVVSKTLSKNSINTIGKLLENPMDNNFGTELIIADFISSFLNVVLPV